MHATMQIHYYVYLQKQLLVCSAFGKYSSLYGLETHCMCVCGGGGGGTYTIIIILKEKYFHLIISANCHLLLE